MIDPTTSNVAEMTIPFVYPFTYIDLTSDYQTKCKLGELAAYQLAPLKYASYDISQMTALTITYYAWFEDVELQAPTHIAAHYIKAQSGREDETTNKPVSQLATAVAKVAGAVSQVPVIGPYATAIETGAKMASNVASTLGYCQPVNVKEPDKVSPNMTSNMAVCNTNSNVMKITTDIKQELTIDPSIIGLRPVDELSISYIAQKPSFLHKFIWSINNSPDTLLQQFEVNPIQFATETVLTNREIARTAVCGAAFPFSYWRGSLIFHIQVVASAFHRGRLLIQYDPIRTDHLLPLETNLNYSEVIDISTTRDFEVKLGNMQGAEWIATSYDFPETPRFSSSATTGGGVQKNGNGNLSIKVLNRLTSASQDPTVNNDITVIVYVRAGEDFEVCVPRNIGNIPSMRPQSGVEHIEGSLTSPDVVGDMEPETDTHESKPTIQLNKIYMGETIVSFRELLKRFQYYGTLGEANGSLHIYDLPMYPVFQGFPGSVITDPATGFNGCENVLMTYVRSAYLGVRGGTRWSFTVMTPDQGLILAAGRNDHTNASITTYNYSKTNSHELTKLHKLLFSAVSQYGIQMTNTMVNPTLQIEMPFYCHGMFLAGRQRNPYSFTYELTLPRGIGLTMGTLSNTDDVTPTPVVTFVSAAEDFTCLFFIGWPMLYAPVGT